MGCPKLTYSQYSKPAMRCVYNAASEEDDYADGQRTKMTVSDSANYTRVYLGGNYDLEKGGDTTTIMCKITNIIMNQNEIF